MKIIQAHSPLIAVYETAVLTGKSTEALPTTYPGTQIDLPDNSLLYLKDTGKSKIYDFDTKTWLPFPGGA